MDESVCCGFDSCQLPAVGYALTGPAGMREWRSCCEIHALDNVEEEFEDRGDPLEFVCATCLGTVLSWDRDRRGRLTWVHLYEPSPLDAHPITTIVGKGVIVRIRMPHTWEGSDDRD